MPRPPTVPSYSPHKPSGRAVVDIKGQWIYLGKYGSDESRENYACVVADLLAGRPILPPATSNHTVQAEAPTVRMRELANR